MAWEFIKPKQTKGVPVINLQPNGDYIQISTSALEVLEIDPKSAAKDRQIGFAFNADTKGWYIVAKVDVGFLLGANQRIVDPVLRRELCSRFKLDPERKQRLMLDTNLVTKANGCKAILLTAING